MKLLAATAMLGAAMQPAPLREQVLAGRPFAALLAETRRLCPDSPVRSASPAGLLDAEDRFGERLGRRQAESVDRAVARLPDGTPRACADSPGGAACPAGEGLRAIGRAGLLRRFASMACVTPSIWN